MYIIIFWQKLKITITVVTGSVATAVGGHQHYLCNSETVGVAVVAVVLLLLSFSPAPNLSDFHPFVL